MSLYSRKTVQPIPLNSKYQVSDLLEAMGRTAFQARNLSLALNIWLEMLNGKNTIFLGLAGAMVPAGMGKLVSALIEKRFIDCLVSTGANLFHDLHETLGYFHWQGSPLVDDLALRDEGIDRIYDVLASEGEFRKVDQFIIDFSKTLDPSKSYSTRSFFQLLGEYLMKLGKKNGIIPAAYRANVPIYCPAIADSSIGIALSIRNPKINFNFDVIQDVKETAQIVINSRNTGVIYIGGGTPKNFIQQTEVTACNMGIEAPGHKYAIQITTDAPHWGGLSGCTFEEALSWGKIHKKAKKVTLYCDSTIALPLLVTGLSQRHGGKRPRRFIPELLSILER